MARKIQSEGTRKRYTPRRTRRSFTHEDFEIAKAERDGLRAEIAAARELLKEMKGIERDT